MKTATESYRSYRALLEGLLHEEATYPIWLGELRRDAMSRFEALGFPSTRLEEWKYTDVGRVRRTAFELPASGTGEAVGEIPFAGVEAAQRLVFVNGRFRPDLSDDRTGPARVFTLERALEDREAELKENFLGGLDYHDRAFVALNTALFRDAALIEVGDNVRVDRPLHVVFASTATRRPVLISPRLSIRVGRNARFRFIESYVGCGNGPYLTNAVTVVRCAENAVVDHLKFQNEAEAGIHIAMHQTRQGPDSVFRSTSVSLGGSLVRNDLNVLLDGRGSECVLNGLYLAAGRQHVDNHTFVDHAVERTFSRELYKGILAGRARGVFNGAILVRQDAQKVAAGQQNRNLLLSDDAVINTKPELQILADDVKCSHGATIGQLEPEALFYLRTRGFDLDRARRVLTRGFASEVLSSQDDPSLVGACEEHLERWLSDEMGAL